MSKAMRTARIRHLVFSAIPCVAVSGNVPEDAMKLVDRAGGKRVQGQVYLHYTGARPAYRLKDGVLSVTLRSSETVLQAFEHVGIAYDLPKGQTSVRIEVEGEPPRVWQCEE